MEVRNNFGGINNVQICFIAVFDPDSVKGFSPSTDQYIPTEFQKNTALHYILLPITNYLRAVGQTDYNLVEQFLISDEEKQLLLIFKKLRGSSEVFAGILYNFDNELKIKRRCLGR